jgi:hypothetical protein
MENLGNKSKEELLKIKNEYVKRYIGDFNKPTEYNLNLKILNRTIQAKG